MRIGTMPEAVFHQKWLRLQLMHSELQWGFQLFRL